MSNRKRSGAYTPRMTQKARVGDYGVPSFQAAYDGIMRGDLHSDMVLEDEEKWEVLLLTALEREYGEGISTLAYRWRSKAALPDLLRRMRVKAVSLRMRAVVIEAIDRALET